MSSGSLIPPKNMFVAAMLKRPRVILLFATWLLGLSFTALAGFDEVVAALRTDSATELDRYMDENIVISLPDKTDTYNKEQAVLVLQDFFANNGVRGFDLQFKGENGGSQFGVGK